MLRNDFWSQCQGYKRPEDNPRHFMNIKLATVSSVAMLPLIDIPNHRQPVKLDNSDFVTFTF